MSDSSLSKFRSELRENQRLRLGLGLCVAIIWLYGVLLLQEHCDEQQKQYVALEKRMARLGTIAGQEEWSARLAEARNAQKDLSQKLWAERTQGLAQAAFQDWIQQASQQSGIFKPMVNVTVQDGPKGSGADVWGDLWKVNARMAFEFEPRSMSTFLEKLARSDKWIVVDALNIRTTPAPRAEVTFVAYFKKSGQ